VCSSDLDDLLKALAQVTTSTQQHLEDISLIGKKLMDLAEEYNWCSDYDVAVEELNELLNVSLPVRKKKHVMTLVLDIEYTCEPDDAINMADSISRNIMYCSDRVGTTDYEIVDTTVSNVEEA
jgi:hypothetical protein